ncbi:MAG: hypothetical protein JNM19_12360 [Chitinophagaceae bacterium]|nr:hypothetical protein [Chitinophagaceae bacterium]
MPKPYFLPLILIATFLYSCKQESNSTIQPDKKGFSWFELSYKGGWTGQLSFCVDSNRIFFFPSLTKQIDGETVKYGLLPDSIFKKVDTLTWELKSIPSLNPDSNYCDDCAEVSIMAITGIDTIRVFMEGNINDRTRRLIEQLEAYKKSSTLHQLAVAYFYLATMKDVLSPLPPRIFQ